MIGTYLICRNNTYVFDGELKLDELFRITDVEQALSESKFVFSRNRLNVALTRAKKKCIVFLTDAVLSYPIEALSYDDPELIDGIDYVCGFRDYMKDSNIGNSDSIINDTIECYRKK